MAMVVMLLAGRPQDLTLGPEATARLSQLGVTFAAVLADDEGVAVLLDGSRFDPDRSTGAALESLGVGGGARTLQPLAQMTVPSGP
jgi:hypothetical protein